MVGPYSIIDKLPSFENLVSSPSALWLLHVLEISVKCKDVCSMLLEFPSYPLIGTKNPASTWTPPFIAYNVPLGMNIPTTVGAVMRSFTDAERSINVKDGIMRKLYHMGITAAELTPRETFVEYKQSPREREKTKCYKICRFSCKVEKGSGILNVADPEGLKGIYFLPLSNIKNYLQSYDRGPDGLCELFLGRPIASNLSKVLSSDGEVERLIGDAVDVEESIFRYSLQGVVVLLDISGFGEACKIIRSQMGTFEVEGEDVESWFAQILSRHFGEELIKCGIVQFKITGDGFMASVPCEDATVFNTLKKILRCIIGIRKIVKKFDTKLSEYGGQLDLRVALHWGNYRYGRIASSFSLQPDFEGRVFTELARIEEGMKMINKGFINCKIYSEIKKIKNCCKDRSSVKKIERLLLKYGPVQKGKMKSARVAISSTLMELCSDKLKIIGDINYCGRKKLQVKEKQCDFALFGFDD